MNREGDFIESIFNYCDGWCERCPFTSRCRSFAMQREFFDDEHDIRQDAFWRNMSNLFAHTKQMLIEEAEKRGIDLNANSEEIEREIEQKNAFVERQDLLKLAKKYGKDADKLLRQDSDLTATVSVDEFTFGELIEVLIWYQHLIGAKIYRGLHGLADLEDEDDVDMREAAQNDADGSIKVALIAIDRSQAAWGGLLNEENQSQVKPLIKLLETIRRQCEEKFPNARSFIRPGFDELETVM